MVVPPPLSSENPRIVIAIPVYNEEPYIIDALNDLLNQDDPKFIITGL